MSKEIIGVVGSGAMGSGIAQIAATNGHKVYIFDNNKDALVKSKNSIEKILNRLIEKGKITSDQSIKIKSNLNYVSDLKEFKDCNLIIEAIVENINIKKEVFENLENIATKDCILATNTSSLSVASIASACKDADRVIGIHFFNPAPLMPLVEIIPAIQTNQQTISKSKKLIDSWGKETVITKDTPGFIVNRVARPFYGEALRIYEEGIADFATIDWAMTELGGFKMGPFTLMDFIGNDVNYKVTETVFEAFYYDPRYKPSLTQKRHFEAGWYGRKTGKGYFDYSNDEKPLPQKNEQLGKQIVERIVVMLINEAVDALYLNIANKEDLETAMTKGVNYPKGLLHWCDELGSQYVLNKLDELHNLYLEDRYRASVLLRKMAENNQKFFS
ncbi:MAG: hypothetical protein Kow0079_10920 [Vicingaceae bacterium]